MLKRIRLIVLLSCMSLPLLMGQGCPQDDQLMHIPGTGAKNGTGPGTGAGTGGGKGPMGMMTPAQP